MPFPTLLSFLCNPCRSCTEPLTDIVVLQPGGQDSQLVAPDLSTHHDATYLLQTHDHPPAYISVKAEGWRVGPRDILEKLEDAAVADEVDPKSYSFRLFVHMETGDTRYLHLNTGMWVGSGVRRGTEGQYTSVYL